MLITVLSVAACRPYPAVRSEVGSDAAVRIRFSQPKAISVAQRSGDSLVLRNVSVAEGSFLSAAGDTLRLSLAHVHDAQGGRLALPAGVITAVVRDVGTIVTTGQSVSGCAERVTLGVIEGILLGLLLFSLVPPIP